MQYKTILFDLSGTLIGSSNVFPGIPELLAKLRTANCRMCIVTSLPAIQAKKVLRENGIDHFFIEIKGSTPQHSDKKLMIQEILALIPSEKKETMVMIGDGEFDMYGAKNNGIDTIAVTYGFSSESVLKQANPTHIANSVNELETLLL